MSFQTNGLNFSLRSKFWNRYSIENCCTMTSSLIDFISFVWSKFMSWFCDNFKRFSRFLLVCTQKCFRQCFYHKVSVKNCWIYFLVLRITWQMVFFYISLDLEAFALINRFLGFWSILLWSSTFDASRSHKTIHLRDIWSVVLPFWSHSNSFSQKPNIIWIAFILNLNIIY